MPARRHRGDGQPFTSSFQLIQFLARSIATINLFHSFSLLRRSRSEERRAVWLEGKEAVMPSPVGGGGGEGGDEGGVGARKRTRERLRVDNLPDEMLTNVCVWSTVVGKAGADPRILLWGGGFVFRSPFCLALLRPFRMDRFLL